MPYARPPRPPPPPRYAASAGGSAPARTSYDDRTTHPPVFGQRPPRAAHSHGSPCPRLATLAAKRAVLASGQPPYTVPAGSRGRGHEPDDASSGDELDFDLDPFLAYCFLLLPAPYWEGRLLPGPGIVTYAPDTYASELVGRRQVVAAVAASLGAMPPAKLRALYAAERRAAPAVLAAATHGDPTAPLAATRQHLPAFYATLSPQHAQGADKLQRVLSDLACIVAAGRMYRARVEAHAAHAPPNAPPVPTPYWPSSASASPPILHATRLSITHPTALQILVLVLSHAPDLIPLVDLVTAFLLLPVSETSDLSGDDGRSGRPSDGDTLRLLQLPADRPVTPHEHALTALLGGFVWDAAAVFDALIQSAGLSRRVARAVEAVLPPLLAWHPRDLTERVQQQLFEAQRLPAVIVRLQAARVAQAGGSGGGRGGGRTPSAAAAEEARLFWSQVLSDAPRRALLFPSRHALRPAPSQTDAGGDGDAAAATVAAASRAMYDTMLAAFRRTAAAFTQSEAGAVAPPPRPVRPSHAALSMKRAYKAVPNVVPTAGERQAEAIQYAREARATLSAQLYPLVGLTTLLQPALPRSDTRGLLDAVAHLPAATPHQVALYAMVWLVTLAELLMNPPQTSAPPSSSSSSSLSKPAHRTTVLDADLDAWATAMHHVMHEIHGEVVGTEIKTQADDDDGHDDHDEDDDDEDDDHDDPDGGDEDDPDPEKGLPQAGNGPRAQSMTGAPLTRGSTDPSFNAPAHVPSLARAPPPRRRGRRSRPTAVSHDEEAPEPFEAAAAMAVPTGGALVRPVDGPDRAACRRRFLRRQRRSRHPPVGAATTPDAQRHREVGLLMGVYFHTEQDASLAQLLSTTMGFPVRVAASTLAALRPRMLALLPVTAMVQRAFDLTRRPGSGAGATAMRAALDAAPGAGDARGRGSTSPASRLGMHWDGRAYARPASPVALTLMQRLAESQLLRDHPRQRAQWLRWQILQTACPVSPALAEHVTMMVREIADGLAPGQPAAAGERARRQLEGLVPPGQTARILTQATEPGQIMWLFLLVQLHDRQVVRLVYDETPPRGADAARPIGAEPLPSTEATETILLQARSAPTGPHRGPGPRPAGDASNGASSMAVRTIRLLTLPAAFCPAYYAHRVLPDPPLAPDAAYAAIAARFIALLRHAFPGLRRDVPYGQTLLPDVPPDAVAPRLPVRASRFACWRWPALDALFHRAPQLEVRGWRPRSDVGTPMAVAPATDGDGPGMRPWSTVPAVSALAWLRQTPFPLSLPAVAAALHPARWTTADEAWVEVLAVLEVLWDMTPYVGELPPYRDGWAACMAVAVWPLGQALLAQETVVAPDEPSPGGRSGLKRPRLAPPPTRMKADPEAAPPPPAGAYRQAVATILRLWGVWRAYFPRLCLAYTWRSLQAPGPVRGPIPESTGESTGEPTQRPAAAAASAPLTRNALADDAPVKTEPGPADRAAAGGLGPRGSGPPKRLFHGHHHVAQLLAAPWSLFAVDAATFQAPPLVSLFLELLDLTLGLMKDQYGWLRHDRVRPSPDGDEAVSRGGEGAAARYMETAWPTAQTAMLQLLIDVLHPHTRSATPASDAIRPMLYQYFNQAFLQDPALIAMIHHQGYPLAVLPHLVHHVPALHVCSTLVPTIIMHHDHAMRQQRAARTAWVFAGHLAATVCAVYPIAATQDLASNFMVPFLEAQLEAWRNLAERWLQTAKTLPVIDVDAAAALAMEASSIAAMWQRQQQPLPTAASPSSSGLAGIQGAFATTVEAWTATLPPLASVASATGASATLQPFVEAAYHALHLLAQFTRVFPMLCTRTLQIYTRVRLPGTDALVVEALRQREAPASRAADRDDTDHRGWAHFAQRAGLVAPCPSARAADATDTSDAARLAEAAAAVRAVLLLQSELYVVYTQVLETSQS
ncbi:hypothetical protein CXG81DRAFT_28047 [Caulochytrium protostelioides]|uniref:Uncharacterized protein n=1 Tax=Caulochytrium protostelioides TaxID=1555241 RepID=A0A4P9X0C7_9FUNG|nr:hypothetical protein CXG81DRAFT_28047 [Caulochytrium protostelioides]|eukprot:RKO99181.1 hypothetical protein CXG81DRAFT_28047 [Caulochytrium protostelioides]